MTEAQYTLALDWKEFNVSLSVIHSWMQANAGAEYCGLSGNSQLQLHFNNEPSEEEKETIVDYWEALDEESDEATTYKSKEQIKAEEDAAKAIALASASSKLEALGLSAEEIAALRG